MDTQHALTFDDVLLAPNYSETLPKDADTSIDLTKKIRLGIPFLSAAMDTVTEAKLAIAMASEGGIGIIHKNFTIEKQAEEVLSVKKFESGIITNPVFISPEHTLKDVLILTSKYSFSSFPVIDKNKKLVGILTNRDIRFVNDITTYVKDLMTTDLVTVNKMVSLDEAKSILHKNRIEKLPIIDSQKHLKGMLTVKDILKRKRKPNACKDNEGKLCVGAAVGPKDFDRIDAIYKAGADIIVVDTAHGHSKNVLDCIRYIKKNYDVDVIGGNIATRQAAEDLIGAGADVVKIGIGPGSICTTRVISGVGMPQITAITDCAQGLKDSNIKMIADGGIKYSGDIPKAMVAGADAIMMGSALAGCEESPGRTVYMKGRKYKAYRGMGSVRAMIKGSKTRYGQDNVANDKLVPEGVEGIVPYKGSVEETLYQLTGGLKSAMGYTGSGTIAELKKKGRFIRITAAAHRESYPHDITITDEAPNYKFED